VRDCFGIRVHGAAVQAVVREVHLPVQSPELTDSLAAKSIDARHDAWKADMPLEDEDALWTWLDRLDEASRQALLAHCVSFGVNALFERPNPYSGTGISQHGLDRRLHEADRLARVTGLDLVEAGWRPTVANYLGRVTKLRILEAVREGVGEGAAQLIDHLKKGDMAKEAERLLVDSGWLPEPLRMVDEPAPHQVDEDESVDLPDFLAGDAGDGGAEQMVAAE
jgi:ParB family chromosome partitioning protein